MQHDDETLMSLGKAAKILGVNKSTLSRQIRSGQVRSHEGRVRVSEVRADRAANVDATRSDRHTGAPDGVAQRNDATAGATPATPSPAMALYADARSRKEDATARLRQMEADRLAGKLLPADAVLKHVASTFRGFKKMMQGMPPRFASEIAGRLGCDGRALEGEMQKMIELTLAEMSAPVIRAGRL